MSEIYIPPPTDDLLPRVSQDTIDAVTEAFLLDPDARDQMFQSLCESNPELFEVLTFLAFDMARDDENHQKNLQDIIALLYRILASQAYVDKSAQHLGE